mmetsp:Transcript_29790/g.53549  ORF Transcript_29790/g.53549 Transcript_29790/m.53549 type:complete len:212 (+) Transcript_29790:217-852(+)
MQQCGCHLREHAKTPSKGWTSNLQPGHSLTRALCKAIQRCICVTCGPAASSYSWAYTKTQTCLWTMWSRMLTPRTRMSVRNMFLRWKRLGTPSSTISCRTISPGLTRPYTMSSKAPPLQVPYLASLAGKSLSSVPRCPVIPFFPVSKARSRHVRQRPTDSRCSGGSGCCLRRNSMASIYTLRPSLHRKARPSGNQNVLPVMYCSCSSMLSA